MSTCCLLVLGIALGVPANAQLADAPPAPDAPLEPIAAPTPTPAAALPAVVAPIQWHELSAIQQTALSPLKSMWNSMSDSHRRKWLALAKNFKQLSDAEKSKLHERMQAWSALSSKERDQARLNFAQTQKITPEQRLAQWQAYQALDDDAKKALAEQAPRKPKGAALVIKPKAADALPAVTPKKPSPTTKPAQPPRFDPRTLLPLRTKP